MAQQGEFLVALFNRGFNFLNDIFHAAAALTPAHIGHDAVGAEIIAAIHNGNPSRKGALTHAMAFKFTLVDS